ncbi:MAG: hypothetical protein Q7R87_03645 [Nanoarchaeota archaeon]|nr:hypothetical protein [Nanoarchaeota archaeon]
MAKEAVSIHKLISAIVPEPFCKLEKRAEVEKIVKEGLAKKNKRVYLEASKAAEPMDYSFFDFTSQNYNNPSDLKLFERPIEKHTLEYDSFGEGLEPIYFWIIDKLEQDEGVAVERLIDTFQSSAGSGHFSEMGLKAARMQEEGMKMLGAANQLVKTVLSIIYDLKDFKLRLKIYKEYHDKDPIKRKAALLSLKQIWMDSVDLKRGTSSIKGMAQQFDYVTVIDAFMAVPSLEALETMDLNDRVKRILQQRVLEFYNWLEESERELTKRFEIEKEYLRSQVNTLKMYARWAKPYLKAARDLTQNEKDYSALVKSFNTTMTEVTLLGKIKYKTHDDIIDGNLPSLFDKIKTAFNQVIIVEFTFRGAPEKAGQGYGFRGKAKIDFTSYVLTDQEIEALKISMDEDDLDDIMKYVLGATDESLAKLAKDLDEFLDDKPFDVKSDKISDESNPFSALFSIFIPQKKSEGKDKKNDVFKTLTIKPNTTYEKIMRNQAIISSRRRCWRVYDLYKKTHGMPSLPNYT